MQDNQQMEMNNVQQQQQLQNGYTVNSIPQQSQPTIPYAQPKYQGTLNQQNQDSTLIQGQQFLLSTPVIMNPPLIIEQTKEKVIDYEDINLPFEANDVSNPIQINCPSCKQQSMTYMKNELGSGTYLIAYILFFFTGCCCCWIPCCISDCKDKIHHCSLCQAEVGIKTYDMC